MKKLEKTEMVINWVRQKRRKKMIEEWQKTLEQNLIGLRGRMVKVNITLLEIVRKTYARNTNETLIVPVHNEEAKKYTCK